MKQLLVILALVTLNTCRIDPSNMDTYKDEILKIEKEFANMADKKGIAEAFMHFAAEDAVLMRNNQLIKGKSAIQDYFLANADAYKLIKLQWLPDKIDVAESGELAYTYGSYQVINTISKKTSSTGVFHTVWKRQSDGQWRFVWD